MEGEIGVLGSGTGIWVEIGGRRCHITKGLCPTSDGGIHIESKLNTGSLFWFYVQDLS